jgi:acyl transferase domain-containing protein
MMSSDPSGAAEQLAEPSRAAVLLYVRTVIARIAGVTVADLTGPDALRDLRIDSLTRMNITLGFEHDLGEMLATLMFEYHTVEDLADHFLDTRQEQLRNVLPAAEARVQPESPGNAGRPTRGRPSPGEAPASEPASEPVADSEDIAVIAVTGRYPGAPDIESLWRNLCDGVNSITEVPPDRWAWRDYFDAQRGRPDKSYGRWGGFIDGVADFDAEFFGILPRDAANIDPQERLFLHACWDLLEQAGSLGATTHQPDTGVFVGTMNSTYGKMGAAEWPVANLTGTGSAPWSIANRVSYVFDFHGPSFAVDSACSSSLVAVHLACESLRRGECAAAIAGGVNVILHPSHLVGLAATGMLASGPACKVFDAAADGYVPGEGVGAVLLKPLAAALSDGDRIWGIIKAGAINTAGRTSGFTVPSPSVQADLVTKAIRRAGVAPHTISYVEAHGTGTELGDPIELTGLIRALGPERPQARPCDVGSVKANIGHLEGAAGIAGLTKVLLQLKYRQIAPCANLDTVNPKISDVGPVLDFPRRLTPWQAPEEESPDQPLRAGVSSFGAGGTNVHLIVEEFLPGREATVGLSAEPASAAAETEQVLLLSARTADQLRTLAAAVAAQTRGRSGEAGYSERLAFSTQVGRKEMTERLAVPFWNLTRLCTALEDFAAGKQSADVLTGSVLGNGRGRRQPDDEDVNDRAYVEALTESRRVGKLARLWVDGLSVDWSRVWTGQAISRVDLPPYPFAMKRYWSPATPAPAAGRTRSEAVFPATLVPGTGNAAAFAPGSTANHDAAVEWDLRLAACGFLMVDPNEVDIAADLMELGFDSVSLVELTAQIAENYGIEFDAIVVLDYPTLKAMADHLVLNHAAAVARRHGANVGHPPAAQGGGAAGGT